MNEAKKLWSSLTFEEKSWFEGSGIDIGCGNDPIKPDVKKFDMADGDANEITKHVSQSFDYVFSSHCLEHMYHPDVTIKDWWKLVKPGGILMFVVPDEDLYEQGVFPSRFNPDHKATFTLSKRKSWSPVSFNVLDLANSLENSSVVKLELQDLNYKREQYSHSLLEYDRWLCRIIRVADELRFNHPSLDIIRNHAYPIDQTSSNNAMAQIFCAVRKILA